MLSLLIAVFAAQAEPASLVGFYPSQVLRNEIVEFKPAKGHHFSAEAPQNCGTGQVNQRTPRGIKCLFNQSGATRPTLNVCDDAKTFCKPISFNVNVSQGGGGAPASQLSKNEQLNKDLKHKMVPGFSEGSPGEITARAATEKQPVLIMVSTDWCPTCNEAKEYLLTSPAFANSTKDWFKVYVDGDSLGASEWNKSVPFHYFPSFILLNSRMEEVGRFTGQLRQGQFETWAKEQEAHLEDPIAQLKPRVFERREGRWVRKVRDLVNRTTEKNVAVDETRLLKHALDMGDRDLIVKMLEREDFPGEMREEILKFRLAELEKQEKQKNQDLKNEKIKIYVQLLEATFQNEHWSEHVQSLCELDLNTCKPFAAKIPQRISFLSKQPGLFEAEKESQLGEEYYYITQIYQALDDKTALQEFAAKCSERFESMGKNSQLKISRAGSQGLIACYELAGEFAREEKAVNALIDAYPAEPTFLIRKAKMLRRQKKPDLALEMINKAEGLAFGYNWYNLQLLKGETFLDLKKPDKAREVVDATLAQVRLDGSSDLRNQNLVAKLRGLQSRAAE